MDSVFLAAGMLSAAASLGMILLWDVDGGLTQIDKYLYSSEDYIKVGVDAPTEGTVHSCVLAPTASPLPLVPMLPCGLRRLKKPE